MTTPSKTPRADAGLRVSVYGDVRCDMEVARLLQLELNAERATSATLASDLAAAQEALKAAEVDRKEAIAIAGLLFDAWEDGTPCYETDGESYMGASLGNAFKLSDKDFARCTEFLNRVDPRGTAIDAAIAGEGT